MRHPRFIARAVLLLALSFHALPALGQSETSHAVAEGGIHVPGWQAQLDARDAGAGQKPENARLTREDSTLHVTTGPTITYWHPDNRAGDRYTVSATFTEPAYMKMGGHPHPYGLVVAGSGLGSSAPRYLYCAAYGNGTFIVRGFGPEPFQMNGPRAEANDAVHKAAEGAPVTQEIAVSVDGDAVACAINGTVVARYDRAAVLGEGKLDSTDGLYGIRVGHNTEVLVSNLKIARQ